MLFSPVAQKGCATGVKSLNSADRQHGLVSTGKLIFPNAPESQSTAHCRRPLSQKPHLDFFALCLAAEMEEN